MFATNCLIPRNGETEGRNSPFITLARKVQAVVFERLGTVAI
jgi:hypothetical protein